MTARPGKLQFCVNDWMFLTCFLYAMSTHGRKNPHTQTQRLHVSRRPSRPPCGHSLSFAPVRSHEPDNHSHRAASRAAAWSGLAAPHAGASLVGHKHSPEWVSRPSPGTSASTRATQSGSTDGAAWEAEAGTRLPSGPWQRLQRQPAERTPRALHLWLTEPTSTEPLPRHHHATWNTQRNATRGG